MHPMARPIVMMVLLALTFSTCTRAQTYPNWSQLADVVQNYFIDPSPKNAEALCCLIEDHPSFFLEQEGREGWSYEDIVWNHMEELDYAVITKDHDAVQVAFHLLAVTQEPHLENQLEYVLSKLIRIDPLFFLAECSKLPMSPRVPRGVLCSMTAGEGSVEEVRACKELPLRQKALASVQSDEYGMMQNLFIKEIAKCIREQCEQPLVTR
jgi:hypothetical protein